MIKLESEQIYTMVNKQKGRFIQRNNKNQKYEMKRFA